MRSMITVLLSLLFFCSNASAAKETEPALDLEISYIKSPAPINAVPAICLKITSKEDAESMDVRIESSGALSVRSPETRSIRQRFTGISKGRAEIINLPLICLPEEENGKITINVEIRDAKNRLIKQPIKQEINGYLVDGLLYYGMDPTITLMQTYITDLQRAGKINTEESLRRRQDLITNRTQ